jgi:signal peptidase I
MKEKHPILYEILDFAKMILFSFIFVLLLTNFIIRPVQVMGPSMHPTLKNEEMGFTNIISLKLSGIQRYDVVVAYLETKDEQIVKRVIGMPNDTVSCVDGVVYVNGEAIDEYYLDDEFVLEQSQLEYDGKFTKDFSEFVLGNDEYFLLGDNRLHSSDSRVFGVFQKEDIVSKHVYVWYPFSEMRVVK